MPPRVIAHRLPSCPGQDSRYTIRRHGGIWWVHYQPPGGDLIPADDPHTDLVDLVNALKTEMGQSPGGSFSINEHGQVIARMSAPPGQGNAMHAVGVHAGSVAKYSNPIVFGGGALTPISAPSEGAPWTGPLCGMTYKFAATGNRRPPTRNLDEVFVEEEGHVLHLSAEARINPYPPTAGALADFLLALRRQLPSGGRFRVNEHGRAFTSNGTVFIGTIPHAEWFPPLTLRA